MNVNARRAWLRKISQTHFSSLSACCALRVAIVPSESVVLCERFVFAATLGSGFAMFLFEEGLDVIRDFGFKFSWVATSVRGGFAYTVNDRVFLVVERVATGMVL